MRKLRAAVLLVFLALLSITSAYATCDSRNPAGPPFNCTAAVSGPTYTDLVFGGATSGPQNGQQLRWTWGQILTGTTLTSPVIVNATISSLNAPLSGADGGTGVANTGKTITLGGSLVTLGPITIPLQVPALLTGSVAYSIPGDYADLPAAFTALASTRIAASATVTITLPAGITNAGATPYRLYHPDSNRIIVTGQAPTTTAFTVTGVSGSAGAYSVTGTVGSATGIVNGAVVELFGATGCTYASPSTACLHQGAWKVTSVVGTTIIVTNTNWHGGTPPNSTVMSMRVYPTTLKWVGSANGIQAYHGYFTNLALLGDNTADAIGFSGYIPNGAAVEKDGTLTVDHVISNGWELAGFSFIDNGSGTYTSAVSSNNGYYGFYVKEGGHLRCNTCSASGNGYEDGSEAVSSGFIAKDNSTLNLADPLSFGNRRTGYNATFGMVLVENANPPLSYANDYGYEVYAGFMQTLSWKSYAEVVNSVFVDAGGKFLGRSGIVNTPLVNAIEGRALSFLDVQSATITGDGAGHPANGVKASSSSRILANSTNITTSVGNAAYLAQDGAYIDSTSATGSVGSSPSVGTIGNNGAQITQANLTTNLPITLGKVTAPGVMAAGTKFTTTGCSVSATSGGGTAGVFTLGANSCTVVVTLNGATGFAATNGWQCVAVDRTAPTVLIGGNSSSSTTTASFVIPAGAGATDVIGFACTGY